MIADILKLADMTW